jgi:hypothetical protein
MIAGAGASLRSGLAKGYTTRDLRDVSDSQWTAPLILCN